MNRSVACVCACAMAGLALIFTGCAGGEPSWQPESRAPKSKYISGGMKALNYTPYYIHSFEVEGPGEVGGGGPNIMPAESDGHPSGGGKESCCMTFPRQWQPDLRVTVRWLVEKVRDGKTPGYWYKAENVRIAQYDGSQTGGAWAIFLPGDRVRLMIVDGNHDGGNNVNNRPADDDPLIAQGVRDDEWNLKYRRGGLR
ncbi:DUF3304 domain-containing protein [Cupriavidus sp. CP313]